MIKLSLEQNELLLCMAALNEVRTGFHVPDFEHVIGSQRDTEALHQRLTDEYCRIDAWPAEVAAQRSEAAILVNATRAALQELDHEREFHARLGESRAFAFSLLSKLEGAFAAG